MSHGALPQGVPHGMSPSEEATARTLIMALIHRYATLARDHADYGQIAQLFEGDALMELPDGRKMPPIEVGEMIQQRPPPFLRHHVTSVDIQFQSADAAHAQSFMFAQTHLKIHDQWGCCNDVIIRQKDGTWRFREKAVVLDGVDPDGWFAALAKAEEEPQEK